MHTRPGTTQTTVIAVVLALLAAAPHPAAAQRDYAPGSRAWNGLAELQRLATEAGIVLQTPEELDLTRLSPADAVLLIYPNDAIPTRSLGEFMRAGGRVAIADDFGAGGELFRAYGIRRHRPSASRAPHLRGNPHLPVAEPHAQLRHPLTSGVNALVANHPTVLAHPDLEPLFTFGGKGALVLVGAVGEGRLVALGDPSLLINNMLQFRGNEAFASNLLSYLEAGRGGRLWLVSGKTPIVGHFGDPSQPLPRVRKWLADFASTDVPPLALVLSSLLLIALFVLVATSSLPRRSPYDGSSMLPQRTSGGGFAGRVAFFRSRRNHLMHPLMVYKFEMEGELLRRLGLTGRPTLRDVVRELRKRGFPEAELQEARELLTELDRLRSTEDRPPGPPRIGERKLRRMVETGERILARLESEGEAV